MIGSEKRLVIETPRLRLRTFRQDDLPLLIELCGDPAVMEFLGGPIGPEAVLTMVQGAQDAFLSSGVGKIAMERRSDGAFLGTCGLSREPWYPEDLEVGWRLRPEFWGNGYATEAGRAWIDYAFGRLRAERVISIADVPNVRSRAVMQRLGMRIDHRATLSEGENTFEALVSVLTRRDWAEAQPNPTQDARPSQALGPDLSRPPGPKTRPGSSFSPASMIGAPSLEAA